MEIKHPGPPSKAENIFTLRDPLYPDFASPLTSQPLFRLLSLISFAFELYTNKHTHTHSFMPDLFHLKIIDDILLDSLEMSNAVLSSLPLHVSNTTNCCY